MSGNTGDQSSITRWRDPRYFDFPRPELLALVPESARRVLDIGCGAGRLGESIEQRQAAEVIGVERDEPAAMIARTRLDQVHVGDVEQLDFPFEPASFDLVICGDVLQQLNDPMALLRRVRRWVRPDGRLIASFPNVRHWSVLATLLDGNWTAQSAGVLDRDHRMHFTRREIEKALFRTGFRLDALGFVPGPGHDEWARQGKPGTLRIGRIALDNLAPEEVEEFYTVQFIANAVPVELPDFGLTSIVIPVWNELPYTRQCIDSIFERTDEPFELIVVDNGSTDGTAEYLKAIPGVTVLSNPENRGFPAAVNQGIAAARGRQILLLNNDCVVTTGWLRRLLAALHCDPTIGLVGPCTSFAAGPQQVPIGYNDLLGLDGLAWDWGKANDRILVDVAWLIGFCLLIRRDVLEAIGLLDTEFGVGCYEDNDLCERAARAGFRRVIARDAFVHHFGGRTFIGNRVDHGAAMRQGEAR